MRAHTPPFTKTTKQVYDETSAIAAAQDAKLDLGNDALPSILADFRAVVKRLDDYAERQRVKRNLAELASESQKLGLYDDGVPAESAYLASFAPNADVPEKSPLAGSRIATPAEIDELRDVLTAEELKGFGIGDVEPRDVAKTATTVATSQHPANAEALRCHDERLNGPEDHL